MWTLANLIDQTKTVSACIDGKWMPCRPENWKHRSFQQRVREAWAVFTGKAEAFTWPGNQ